MEEKKCSKCGEVKKLEDFPKDKKGKFGRYSSCKSCKNKYTRKYNKAMTNEEREKQKELCRKWYAENKERKKQYSKNYRENNREQIRLTKNNYERQRRKEDSYWYLCHKTRRNIRSSLKNKGYTKKSRTYEILGCEYSFFKEYLESKFTNGMSWENREEWHLDHIIPVSSANNEEEIISLNHYLNFQPLWAKDNLEKSDNYKEEDKQEMLKNIRIKKKVII